MAKIVFPLIIVGLFAFVAVFPLLHEGLPPTHDGEYHIVRFYEFDKSLRDGSWYPRWAADLNNGYGVPLFNYVYPLPNYVASFFHFFGISFIDSFKINMFFASIFGAVFFYLWSSQFWGRLGGVVSSIFYTFSPYHFVDIYIRGSVGEVWALAFFPAFLWSITQYIKNQKIIFFATSSVFLSLIIFSHNILALMFLFFALFYVGFLLYRAKNKKYLIPNVLYSILLGLGLSAIFWLPALLERQYVTGLQIFDISAHFPDLYQLLIPSWGSGFSGEGVVDQMSFQIGLANLIIVFVSLLLIIFRHSGLARKYSVRALFRISLRHNTSEEIPESPAERVSQNHDTEHIIIFFLVWFILVFFLMLKVSQPIWQTVPFMNYFQFPWRFLSLEILIASFLAGSVIGLFSSSRLKRLSFFIALVLIVLTFSLGVGYAKPAHYLYRDDNYYISRPNFIDGTNSPGNAFNTIYFKNNPEKQEEKIAFITGEGYVETKEVKSESYLFKLNVDSKSKTQVNTAYFPGWSVFVDGETTKTDITSDGLFSFYLPKGNHEVKVRFVNTPIRNFAVFVFFISGAVLIILFIKSLFATIKR